LQVHERNVRPIFSELFNRFAPIGRLRDELHIAFICRKRLYPLAQYRVIVG
jgi:hypothetical protein